MFRRFGNWLKVRKIRKGVACYDQRQVDSVDFVLPLNKGGLQILHEAQEEMVSDEMVSRLLRESVGLPEGTKTTDCPECGMDLYYMGDVPDDCSRCEDRQYMKYLEGLSDEELEKLI